MLKKNCPKIIEPGTFHVKMGTIKDRNGMDLIEAGDVKRLQEYTELYKKAPPGHRPDLGRGVTPHSHRRQLRGPTPCPRSRAVAERSNRRSKEQRLCSRRAERSYSTFNVRRGGPEEIPLLQGREQQLRFAGGAVKRYPTFKVIETQVTR